MHNNQKRFQIDHDVPYPGKPKKSEAGRPSLYPFAEMAIGDSFFVASEQRYFSRESGLAASLTRARKETGFNLHWVREPDGFRIFRLAGEYQMRQRKPYTPRNPNGGGEGQHGAA